MLKRNRLPAFFLWTIVWIVLAEMPPVSLASSYQILHNFAGGNDGGGLFTPVSIDAKGDLFGTTWGSGPNGHGIVFELIRSRDGWKKVTIHSFCSEPDCSDGSASTWGGVIVDAEGNLYGTSSAGTFQLSPGPDSWTYQLISPHGAGVGYVMDGVGNLFGFGGLGDCNQGSIAELSGGPGNWTEQELYSFCGVRDGWGPQAAMTFDAKGNLYGTMEYGGNALPWCFGSAGCGVVFRLSHSQDGTWKYHVLHRFAAFQNDGQTPLGGVVVDKSGNVYGTTAQAGKGGGTIFRLSRQPDGHWRETILYNFPHGGYPMSTMVFDRAGDLYGTATAGGDPVCDCGVIFKMTHQPSGKWTYSVLYKFTWAMGAGPNGLTIDSKGHLYGTTAAGGKHNFGVAFKFVP